MMYRPWFYHEPTNTSEDQYYHYIYYNLPQKYLEISNAGLTFLLAVAFTNTLIGAPANLLKLVMILKEEKLRTTRYSQFFYQGVVDLIISGIYSPALLAALFNGRLSKTTCKALGWIPLYCYQSQLMSSVLLGLMQLARMRKPEIYRKCLQKNSTVAIMVIVIFFAFSLVLPTLTGHKMADVSFTWDPIVMSCNRDTTASAKLFVAVTNISSFAQTSDNSYIGDLLILLYYMLTGIVTGQVQFWCFIYLSYRHFKGRKVKQSKVAAETDTLFTIPGKEEGPNRIDALIKSFRSVESKSTAASADYHVCSIYPAHMVCSLMQYNRSWHNFTNIIAWLHFKSGSRKEEGTWRAIKYC